ncbi:hypothetical protein REPUB_Repub07fG0021300 [Reevesia pubescens]
MAPYVSSRPKEAFLNYKDLDIGSNGSNNTDFAVLEVYGAKYKSIFRSVLGSKFFTQ